MAKKKGTLKRGCRNWLRALCGPQIGVWRHYGSPDREYLLDGTTGCSLGIYREIDHGIPGPAIDMNGRVVKQFWTELPCLSH